MKYYAFKILPGGKKVRLKPGGRRFFGRVMLAYLKRRAKRHHYRMIVKAVNSPRDKGLAWVRWALANESQMHYAQVRPMSNNAAMRHLLPLRGDCSTFVTWAWLAAGLPDPNLCDYDGTGFTGTLRARGFQIALTRCQLLDYIVYGTGNGTHTVLVLKGGKDPLVASFGQENGPKVYRHSEQVAVHGNHFTCHSANV